jgi:hypothetical protein
MANPLCICCEKKSVKAGQLFCHSCEVTNRRDALAAIDAQSEQASFDANVAYGFRLGFGQSRERTLVELR